MSKGSKGNDFIFDTIYFRIDPFLFHPFTSCSPSQSPPVCPLPPRLPRLNSRLRVGNTAVARSINNRNLSPLAAEGSLNHHPLSLRPAVPARGHHHRPNQVPQVHMPSVMSKIFCNHSWKSTVLGFGLLTCYPQFENSRGFLSTFWTILKASKKMPCKFRYVFLALISLRITVCSGIFL